MTNYRLCAAGVTLRNQVNRRWPRRDKASDGWLGNEAHQKTKSDHNPDWTAGGVVRAIDIDADLQIKSGNHALAEQLANELREHARTAGALGRISYIIFNKRIASERADWAWRPYDGINAHKSHIHVSFKPNGDNNGAKFNLPILKSPILNR